MISSLFYLCWSVFLSQNAWNKHIKAQLDFEEQIAEHGQISVSLQAIFIYRNLFLEDSVL